LLNHVKSIFLGYNISNLIPGFPEITTKKSSAQHGHLLLSEGAKACAAGAAVAVTLDGA